jgi:hypothetical protein
VEVRALDDTEPLKAAEPRWLGGELFDPEAVRAMAKRLARAEAPLVVVLLGGEHDLRDALAERAPSARYVRLTVEAYKKAAGEKTAEATGRTLQRSTTGARRWGCPTAGRGRSEASR